MNVPKKVPDLEAGPGGGGGDSHGGDFLRGVPKAAVSRASRAPGQDPAKPEQSPTPLKAGMRDVSYHGDLTTSRGSNSSLCHSSDA